MMVGRVIRVNTSPPTRGAERGNPKKLRNTAKPSNPKTMDGTAARLLMLISIKSVHLFLGANSSRYMAAATPTGKDNTRVTIRVKKEPIVAPRTPASSGSLESPAVKKVVFHFFSIFPPDASCLIQAICLFFRRPSPWRLSCFKCPLTTMSTSSSAGTQTVRV